ELGELDEHEVGAWCQLNGSSCGQGSMRAAVVHDALAIQRQERRIIGGRREGIETRARDGEIAVPAPSESGRRRAAPRIRNGQGGGVVVHLRDDRRIESLIAGVVLGAQPAFGSKGESCQLEDGREAERSERDAGKGWSDSVPCFLVGWDREVR